MLESFFLDYAGQQKPAPYHNGKYTCVTGDSHANQSNFLLGRWVDSMMQADAFHSDGGGESYHDWLTRGPYYHFRWPKDANESSTRVGVNFKFSQPFAEQRQHQVMLFSQWRSAFKIVHKDGRVQVSALQEL